MRRALVIAVAVVWAQGCGSALPSLDAGQPVRDGGADAGFDAGAVEADAGFDAGVVEIDAGVDAGVVADGGLPVDGIVFVHGINGAAANWNVMVDRFKTDAGFPASRLIAETFADPGFGCNTANATAIAGWVQRLKTDGAKRIAIVAHSMGGLSSRHYLKSQGGTADVAVFVTLGTMHHGLSSPCLSPLPVCVWQELCDSGTFIAALNAAPATPGPTQWTSIFSTGDTTVSVASATLQGANNVQVMGLMHSGANGLQDSAAVYALVQQALR